jgi:hypothetical protein
MSWTKPVVDDASGEITYRIGAAASAGVPKRPVGTSRSLYLLSLRGGGDQGVSMLAGAIAFTVTSPWAYSLPRALIMPMSPLRRAGNNSDAGTVGARRSST